MIDTTKLKKATCRIITDLGKGTGVIVSNNLILTSLHVIEDCISENITIFTYNGVEISASIKDTCSDNDLALLCTGEQVLPEVIDLCNEVPVLGNLWAAHGHPDTEEGQSVGGKLYGTITDTIIKQGHQHDVVLDSGSEPITAKCRGFSGSGVINTREQVTSILRYRDTNAYCSVSIRKAASFFQKNGVCVQEDKLDDFNVFKDIAFQTVAPPFKDICTSQLPAVIATTSPQLIAESLKGELFYPRSEEGLSEIIATLRRSKNINSELWVGWLEMLCYMQLIKGDYQNAKALEVTLKDVEATEIDQGIETRFKQDLKFTIHFFWTKEREYITIVRRYLIEKIEAKTLSNYGCHIFHSDIPRFGLQTLTREDRKKIVADISDPQEAGLQIVGNMYFGTLSFNELSSGIAKSQNKTEAVKNIRKILIDAII